MDGIQAAVLSIKLKYLKKWTQSRRDIAKLYQSELKGIIDCTLEESNKFHVYHIFSVFDNKRDELKKFLSENNVFTNNHYPVPAHKQKPYKYLKYKDTELPNTVQCAVQQLSLPIYPELSHNDVRFVTSLIKNWKVKKNR